MSSEQRIALKIDWSFTNLYNEKVVLKMRNLQLKFPQSLQKDPLLKRNIAEFVEYCQ